ncbi:MAG: DUF6252 family protein [Bacteroidota bacterium]
MIGSLQMVRTFQLICICLFSLFLSSCKEKEDNPVPYVDSCELINGKLAWTFNGANACADANIIADLAIVLTVNGLKQSGESLTFELESVQPGTYGVDDNNNSFTYTDALGMGWITPVQNAGNIVVTSHDAAQNKVKGNFNVALENPLTGAVRTLTGNFRLTYTN